MSSGRPSIRSAVLLTGLVAALPLAAQGTRGAPPATPRPDASRPAAGAPTRSEPAATSPAAPAPTPATPARREERNDRADAAGPREGTWGAEVGTASLDIRLPTATLLRFFSPTMALQVGAGAALATGDESTTAFQLRLGVRRYAARNAPLRPIIGGGVVASLVDQGGQFGNDTAIGAYGEAGAAYFFSPHFSLGAVGELSVTSESNLGQNSIRFRGTLARVIAAVYF
jgi:hypothetical protein